MCAANTTSPPVTDALFHVVMQQAINPVEMVMEAVALIQKRFYEDYPPHPKEEEYNYKCSSTMKPTQMQVRQSVNI